MYWSAVITYVSQNYGFLINGIKKEAEWSLSWTTTVVHDNSLQIVQSLSTIATANSYFNAQYMGTTPTFNIKTPDFTDVYTTVKTTSTVKWATYTNLP